MNTRNLNILITGAGGQLGSEFRYLAENPASMRVLGNSFMHFPNDDAHVETCARQENFNFIFTTRKELDIQNTQQTTGFCQQNKIHVIVNCAAYTAVDKAEQEPELTDGINHLAVKNLAQIAKDQNITLIHISTDYVFDGTSHKPYKETDSTNPQNVYGKTKLDGERALQSINPANSIIIRTSWVYSEFGNNFVKTMQRLGRERDELNVVCDQIGTPTHARDLAKAILQIIPQLSEGDNKKENESVEIYHYSNAGVCSWFDFSMAIFEINNIKCKVNPIPSEAYPTPAKRPYYSVMDKSKITEKFKLDSIYWRESLNKMRVVN